MTEQIVITGPISPADVEHLLTGSDSSVARSITGYRGVPVSELVKAFVAMDVQVEVVTSAPDVDQTVELQGPHLRLLIAPQRPRAHDRAKDLFRRERRAMTALLQKTEASVVHANWTYEFAWAALDTSRPVLITARDAPMTILRYAPDAYRAARTVMAWIVRMRTRDLVAVSPYLANAWRREMLYRREIEVIPNIAPAPLIEIPLERASSHPKIVAIGNSSRFKNMRRLIQAVRILQIEGREIRLDLIGDGLGADGGLAQETLSKKLASDVHFHGYLSRDKLADVLAQGTIFVHPSLEESFGLAVVEAINAGLPVVAGNRSGAVPWVLANGQAGVLVNVTNPEEIAKGIARLLDNEDEARALVARAREHVAMSFSPKVVCEAYLAAYERLGRRNHTL